MGKTNKEKELLLQESETELKLKNYLNKMNKVVGEEYALLTLSSNREISDSLNQFTSKFEDVESNDIAFILLKSALLSNEKNYWNEVTKDKTAFGELNDLVYLVNENLGFRKSLTRTFINQSDKSNKELYENLEDKTNTIRDLSTLNFYEIALKSRNLEKAFSRNR